ncbi:MAG TPA: hypothetical protein ACFYEK_01390 [Candidatus Wunengus sp. YC60]|uniref:hypothetical protein n=1 Tax=Candidatus Wunengus sp. YC60 TaxID=3367697 RepID=UPI0040283A3A
MDIVVAAGSTLATPPAGTVTLFINTEDSNILSYKDSAANVYRYNGNDDDCDGVGKGFAYKLAKDLVKGAECALQNGTMNADEYNTFITTGLNVKVKETSGGDGTKTYDINIGPRNMTESY